MLLKNFELKKDQIRVLIAKDFKLKYNSTALGFFWSLLMPVFSSVIYYFVFGIIMRFSVDNYLLYLLSGTFLWQFFDNVVMMNGNVMFNNALLLKKTSFDRKLLVWGTFFTESIHFLLTIPIMFFIMFMYGVHPQWHTAVLNLPVSIILLAFFSMGLSYIYAALNIYFRDLERIMMLFMQVWMFMTPIFFPVSIIPEKYMWIFKCNPMAGILGIWRDIFYSPGIHWDSWGTLLLISLALFFAGRWIFDKLEPRFAEMM